MLTTVGPFADEAQALGAIEIVPVAVLDETGAVLAVLVTTCPVIRLARIPLPLRATHTENTLYFLNIRK